MERVPRTTVVHVNRDSYDIRIDRPGPWSNPHKIERESKKARQAALMAFTVFVVSDDPKAVWIRDNLHKLVGKRLGCWCAPKGGVTSDDELVCHGQILARMAESIAFPPKLV